MKLSTDFAGIGFKEFHTDITWRRTMNFAAATKESNPLYFDDEREGGVMAPPMFAVAVTWPVSESMWEYLEAEDFPKEVLTTQVHLKEHLVFHRPVRPGDRLTLRGSIAEISPHRAGTLVVVIYRALDGSERPVFTEYSGVLMRGVQCLGSAKIVEPFPPVPARIEKEQPEWEVPIFIEPQDPFVYDGCTNISFPIHTSVAFARKVGLPGIILQGTATLAYALREIINREAGGNPDCLSSVACRFTGMVFPGSEVRLLLSGRRAADGGTDLFFKVTNGDGLPAVSDGYARLGPRGRREIAAH